MLDTLGISLEQYKISYLNGFLPAEPPLNCLPDLYYAPWESIIRDLPYLIDTKQIRERVDALPILSTSGLKTEPEWQRAYAILSFLTHAYIWGGTLPSEILPPAISRPYLKVAAHLELPAASTYSSTNLWNWAPASPSSDISDPSQLTSLHTFTGTDDESWFYLISVAMEARGGAVIPVVLRALDAASNHNSLVLIECLAAIADSIKELGNLLERMYERCDPRVFYYRIRPFLAGSKNMAAAGLPRGVFYDEGDENGSWKEFSGASNAQSSLIQLFDIVLGIDHHANGGIKTMSKTNGFIQGMRNYMPGPHSRFLEQVSNMESLRDYVMKQDSEDLVNRAYNACVAELTALRDKHIQIVTRYVIIPSKTPWQPTIGETRLNLAVASSKKNADTKGPTLHGTGGTQLIPFLRQTRDETKDAAREAAS